MALNTIVLQGRLTKAAELRYTNSGKGVCSFTMAVDRFGKDNGADFINCVAWEKTAEFITTYFSKGDPILVQGQLQSRQYEDRDGNKRTAHEVVVREVNFCGGKKSEAKAEVVAPGFTPIDEEDGELPF